MTRGFAVALCLVAWSTAPAAENPAADANTAATNATAVRAQHVVRCAGVPRPGLAERDGAGGWKGLEVEICRAVAVAALGLDARVVFEGLETDAAFARAGAEDVVLFLTLSEMLAHHVADSLVPGPSVFVDQQAVMVAERAPAQRLADLAGHVVCSLAGSDADAGLDAALGARRIAVRRHPFSEQGEMEDAFRVGRCEAVAGEAMDLLRVRHDGGHGIEGRLLAEPLLASPIVAATPLVAGSRWAAIVAWTFQTLRAADRPETAWRAGGLRALPIGGAGLGLRNQWQHETATAVGSYAAIVNRTFGNDSSLVPAMPPVDGLP